MTGNVPAVEIDLPALPVQELSFNDEGVPEAYVQENVVTGGSLPWKTSPSIDLHKPTSSLLEAETMSYKSFNPSSDTGAVFSSIISHTTAAYPEHRRLYLLAYPEHRRRLQFWPQQPQRFRSLLDAFTVKSQAVLELIFKAMANSMKLEENSFWERYRENGAMFARFNIYPQCPHPDLTLGIKEHTDGSAITTLVQDQQVEGLQVLKDDRWFKVPVIPDALFINVGDQMEMMSNDIFNSLVHRVITNSDKDRVSIAMFVTPELETRLDQWISSSEKIGLSCTRK